MGQNVIEFGFNVEEISAEQKQILALFEEMFEKLDKYDGTRFNPLQGGLADLKKSITDGGQALAAFAESANKYNAVITEQTQRNKASKQGTDELATSMKEYQKIVDQLASTQAKNNAAQSDAAEGLAVEREALRQRNTELRAAAALQLAEAGSTDEAAARIKILTLERKKLNAETAEGAARTAEINEEIDQLNKFIKDNSSKLEQQKINIGNYAESLAPAFDGLKEQLSVINKELAELEKRGQSSFQNFGRTVVEGFGAKQHQNQGTPSAGNTTDLLSGSGNQVSILNQDAEAYQKLTLQQKILEQSLQRQSIGFRTANQEMRNAKNTLDAMELAGLKNTEAFEKLNIAYTDSEQKVKDLHREQAILTTDAPALTALTGIARGLGGAYALGAGAAGVFADGNEKLEKELNKLVAIMTFLQGLEEAVGALKDRNAIATALQTQAEKALILVKQIETKIFGESATVTTAEAEAKTISTAATEANTEAAEANAVGQGVAAAAIEGVTIASEAATGATIAFRTALISTGIGAIIIGLIYGVTKLVGAISDWINADERAEETQKALSESTAQLLGTYKELEEVYGHYTEEVQKDMERRAQLAQDAGKNEFIQLENERKIAEYRLTISKNDIDQKKINQKVVDGLNDKYTSDLEDVKSLEGALAIARKKYGEDNTSQNKKAVEQLEKVAKQAEDDAKNSGERYKIAADKYKAYQDALQALDDNRVKREKAIQDELARLRADAANRQYEIATAANARILDLDSSTEKQRIAAVRGNFAAENALAQSQISAVQKQVEQQRITEEDGADQIANIQTGLNIKYKKALDDQIKIRLEYKDRLLAAQAAIYKNDNESDAAKQDAITKDVQKELGARLSALNQYIDDKTAVINNDYRKELTLAREHGKTQEEIDQLESDRQKALVELTADTQKRIYDIVISYGEQRLKAIEEQNKGSYSADATTKQYLAQEKALNDSLGKNLLADLFYNQKKKKLDEQYIIDKTAADIKDDEAALQRLKDFQDKELQLKIDAANADLIAAKAGGNEDEIAKAQSKVDALNNIKAKGLVSIAELTKKLGEDEIKNEEAKNKKIIESRDFFFNKLAELENASEEFAIESVQAAHEKRIQSIEIETERQDAATDATIANVQRSTLTQRQQAEEVAILTAQKQARDTEAKKQERQEKVAEAKFDRDVAVAKAIWAGAEAEIAAIGEYAGTPYGFAIAAVIAALTAVQVATILAKPIPAYAEGIGIPGRGEHPGGLALVGEDGAERVTPKGGRSFVVDQATLLDLPAGSSVEPLNQGVIGRLGELGMMRGFAILNSHGRDDNGIERAIGAQTNRLERALKRSQKHITNVIIKIDPLSNPNDSFTRKLLGKRR